MVEDVTIENLGASESALEIGVDGARRACDGAGPWPDISESSFRARSSLEVHREHQAQ